MKNDEQSTGGQASPTTPQPKENKKVTIEAVKNGFLVFAPGVPTGEIQIAETKQGALQLADEILG
jgi:hypothetical protein